MRCFIRILLFIVPFFYSISLFAQFDPREGRVVNDGYPGGVIETVNLEKSNVIEGSFFINDYWSVGDVLLYNEKAITSMPLKYNLRDEVLLLLDANQVSRVLRDDEIEKFEWFDAERNQNILFINCLNYNIGEAPLIGFFEIVTEGQVELLLYRTLILDEGYYSVTHDAGNRNDEYKIKENMYLSSDQGLLEVKGKKELYKFFGEHSSEIKRFIKNNNLRLKQTNELARVIDYYNRLLEQ
jgi:hypothetical protein